MAILVMGLGNLLMGDDALGVHVVRRLQERFVFPEEVQLVDGGTLGLDLLPRLEGVERLLIVDALDMQTAAGTIVRLTGEEVPRAFAGKLSVHQMGLQDLLVVAELQGNLPPEVVVWGVQIAVIEPGLQLSPAVAQALEQVVAAVASELEAWGVSLAAA
ncbi:HyaD/HybD family hydrogenase maturation endopeptidase [Desulfuromonas sp. AOP6]|uniref:HyaD/HybD family hydrogenase maturation endopeptidase n=1 Tax=Desulfuromonas sp. AOP6 TaxID=1566351 RepID=UPI001284F67B|nr:HyaD/HybD family hydrogenase maturation endopeptidase [Desulfuromonas sp. AOP6]BCA81049.1 membrane protein [Desulfuromonas sp. AOP6]